MDTLPWEGFRLQPIKTTSDIIAEDFCAWWRNLPSDMKKGKARAWICYRKARTKATAGDLEDGIKAYIRHKPQWQHFAHASTWLNQERWTDEHPGAKSDDVREEYRNWLDACAHSPKCSHPNVCQHLKDVEKYRSRKGGPLQEVIGQTRFDRE